MTSVSLKNLLSKRGGAMRKFLQNLSAVGMLCCSMLVFSSAAPAVQEKNQPQSVESLPGETPQILEVNQPIEREIRGGEVQVFQVHLVVDQFLKFQIEQKGIQLT
ncbi:MAG TPA: hypothetical protein PKE58_17740, partial [Acidobacteriota bacterium]|nr:hypothetical protein [Acidobacteriota bacterium]